MAPRCRHCLLRERQLSAPGEKPNHEPHAAPEDRAARFSSATRTKKSVPPLIGEGMVTRKVRLRAPDVVFLKGIVESLEGLAQVFAERGGDLTLASPADREAELEALVVDLCRELGAFRMD